MSALRVERNAPVLVGRCRDGTGRVNTRKAPWPNTSSAVPPTQFCTMPRNIIHSDVSMDPESESEALSIAPDAEEDPEVEVEEEDEGEGEVEEEDEEGNDGDEGEEGDDGDEVEEEGEDADEAEEEAEDEEAADDGDGDAVQEVRDLSFSHLSCR
jgi:hypothetical protein